MKAVAYFMLLIGIASATCLTACAEFKGAGRDIGHATRDVGRDISRGARGAVKSTGKAVGDAIH